MKILILVALALQSVFTASLENENDSALESSKAEEELRVLETLLRPDTREELQQLRYLLKLDEQAKDLTSQHKRFSPPITPYDKRDSTTYNAKRYSYVPITPYKRSSRDSPDYDAKDKRYSYVPITPYKRFTRSTRGRGASKFWDRERRMAIPIVPYRNLAAGEDQSSVDEFKRTLRE